MQLVEYQEGAGDAGGGRKQSYFVELWDVGESHDTAAPFATHSSSGPTVIASIALNNVEPAQPTAARHAHYVATPYAHVGTHDRYKALRPVFYNQLNGVILVHELANGR